MISWMGGRKGPSQRVKVEIIKGRDVNMNEWEGRMNGINNDMNGSVGGTKGDENGSHQYGRKGLRKYKRNQRREGRRIAETHLQ